MPTVSRRKFITLGAGGIALLAGSGIAARLWPQPAATHALPLSRATQVPSLQPRDLGYGLSPAPTVTETVPPTRSAPSVSLPVPPRVTHNDEFYVIQYDEVPAVSLSSWSLTVHGLVRQPLRLSYEDIKALQSVTTEHTLECIGNPAGGNLIGNAQWRGISLRALLERADVAASATHVVIGGVDEYLTSVPLARALHDHALLVYEMNGEPLPLRHGFPLRALLPGVYGQKQPKWITGIGLSDGEQLGPWEQKGWSRSATLQLNSAIEWPRDAQRLDPGDMLIVGVAHAGEAGVRAVEVSADGGQTWHETTLTRGPSPYVWTLWGYRWAQPAPGKYTLLVRATDNLGKRQDQMPAGLLADVFPDGTAAMHRIGVEVRG